MQQDPLLERIANIQQQNAENDYRKRKLNSEKVSTRVTEQVSFYQKIFGKIFNFANMILSFLLVIFKKVIDPIFGKLFNWTKNLWLKFVFRTDEYGNKRFVPWKAGVFGLALMMQWSLLFVVADLTYYSALYMATRNVDEIVYMTNSQEVDPEADIYSAQGCEKLPCNQDSAIYFRIDPILFNHLWSLTHRGTVFYPDYVAAAVPPTITKCTITSYGIRWKTLMRNWDVYPYLVEASCEPTVNQ